MYVDPDEPAARGRIVAVRADGPGGAMLVRLMAVESGRSILRAANPGRPGMDVPRANETMFRAVVVFVGRAVRGARCAYPSLPFRRPEAAEGAFRGVSPGGGNPVVTGGAKPCAARGAKHFVACRAHDEARRVVRCVALT